MALTETPTRQIKGSPDDGPHTSQAIDSVVSLCPGSPSNEPASPFASPMWSRSPGRELGISRSLPAPITKESLFKSPSFQARQLSFQDWCFNPVPSAERRENDSSQLRSLPTQTSDLDLRPRDCPFPESPEMKMKDKTKEARGATAHTSMSNGSPTRVSRELSAIDLDDLLSCKETLSVSQPIEYGSPPSKRRRSCYAF